MSRIIALLRCQACYYATWTVSTAGTSCPQQTYWETAQCMRFRHFSRKHSYSLTGRTS